MKLIDNPFYVLELEPSCARIEIERQGHKLLAMLEIGLAGAGAYPTPFGARPRTRELVRESMAALRDPRRRLIAEMWARVPTETIDDEPAAVADDADGWSGAMPAFGLGAGSR